MNKNCATIDAIPMDIPFIDRSMMYVNCIDTSNSNDVAISVTIIVGLIVFVIGGTALLLYDIYKKRNNE